MKHGDLLVARSTERWRPLVEREGAEHCMYLGSSKKHVFYLRYLYCLQQPTHTFNVPKLGP